jgi:hypothetical protein
MFLVSKEFGKPDFLKNLLSDVLIVGLFLFKCITFSSSCSFHKL